MSLVGIDTTKATEPQPKEMTNMVARKTAEAAKGTNKQDAVGRRIATKGEPKLANYAGKNVPTRIQEYAEWLEKETGYAVDLRSVYLGSALRGTFQKSDENQERIASRADEIVAERAAREEARVQRAANKEARAQERAAKAEADKVAKAEKAAADKVAKAEAAEAKKAAAAAKAAAPKAAPAKKAPAKPAAKPAAKATPTRRRPAAKAADKGDF